MKKLLVILMLLLPLYGIAKSKEAMVQIIYKDVVRSEFTYEEFDNIMKASTAYSNIISAEANSRVYVELKDNPWEITDGDYSTEAKVIWLDATKKPIKTVTIKIQMKDITLPNPPGRIEKAYTETAKVGFPITIILCIIFAIL